MLMLGPEAITSSLLFMGSGTMGYTADHLGGQLLNVCVFTCSGTVLVCVLPGFIFFKDMMIQTFYISLCVGGRCAYVCVTGHLQRSGTTVQELVLASYLSFWCLLLLLQLGCVLEVRWPMSFWAILLSWSLISP
jgi:hypothetical protein